MQPVSITTQPLGSKKLLFPGQGPTCGLATLVVDVQCSSLVHPCHHLVLSAVEAVDTDDAGFLLGVGIVRVGGVEIVLKDG